MRREDLAKKQLKDFESKMNQKKAANDEEDEEEDAAELAKFRQFMKNK